MRTEQPRLRLDPAQDQPRTEGIGQGAILMNYPYQMIDPASCPYTDDISYCPEVQKGNGCPKDCRSLVTIHSLKEAIAFDEYIDHYMGDDSE